MKDLKPKYHQLLSKVGKSIDEWVNNFYRKEIYPKFPEKRVIYEKMLKKKKGTQKLRGTLTYIIYCSFYGKLVETNKIVPLCTAVELINWASYELNWLFDEKAGVINKIERQKTALAMQGFFNDALIILSKYGKEFIDKAVEIYDRILRGFAAEMKLTIANKTILHNFHKFWELYKIRNCEAVGQFFGNIVELVSLFFKNSKIRDSKSLLKKIFEMAGEYTEILNDLADFVLPREKPLFHEKIIKDWAMDIRNGTITWPIWLMYNKSDEKDRDFLESLYGKNELCLEEGKKLIKILFETGTYKEIKRRIRKRYRELKKELRKLQINKKIRGLLQSSLIMLESNKFYYLLEEDYGKITLVNKNDKQESKNNNQS